MSRSKSSKLDALAKVCSLRRAVEYPDMTRDLRSGFPSLNYMKKQRTKSAKKAASTLTWTDTPHLLGQSRRSAPDMPSGKLKDLILGKGGCHLALIIEKKLHYSDVDEGQRRLSMPLKQILSDDFLNQKEKMILNSTKKGGRRKPRSSVDVKFIDPQLRETTTSLKKWNYTSSSSYVLIKNWNEIVEDNSLSEGDTVQVWFFRVEDRPWIALVKP